MLSIGYFLFTMKKKKVNCCLIRYNRNKYNEFQIVTIDLWLIIIFGRYIKLFL